MSDKPRKTAKQYRDDELVKIDKMVAARKRRAAERHEEIAARFRQEALELDPAS